MPAPSSMGAIKPMSAAMSPFAVGAILPPKPTEFLPVPPVAKGTPPQKFKVEDTEDLDDMTQMTITIEVPNNGYAPVFSRV